MQLLWILVLLLLCFFHFLLLQFNSFAQHISIYIYSLHHIWMVRPLHALIYIYLIKTFINKLWAINNSEAMYASPMYTPNSVHWANRSFLHNFHFINIANSLLILTVNVFNRHSSNSKCNARCENIVSRFNWFQCSSIYNDIHFTY